jgi:hypothetical protein
MSVRRPIMNRAGTGSVVSTLLVACCLAGLFGGCSEQGYGVREGNQPPETFITYLPGHGSPNYKVTGVQWYGIDADGSVVAFEVAVIRNLTQDELENLDYETLSWERTTAKHGDFVLPADSCCIPTDEEWYTVSLWGLLVRAIDNEGAKDPEPDRVFFQAANQIPKVSITAPDLSPGPASLPAHFYLEWEGEDPDGYSARMSYKYIVIPDGDLLARSKDGLPDNPWPGLPPFDDDSTGVGHAAPPVGYWSEWVPADCTSVCDLNLSAYAGTEEYLHIFLTAMDEAGAVLPPALFGGHYNQNMNILEFKVDPVGSGVPIVIDAGSLGRRTSDQPDHQTHVTYLFSGTDVLFTFWGLDDTGTGRIAEAYRTYFDYPDYPGSTWPDWTSVIPIRQPDESPEWMVKFPPSQRHINLEVGQHVFVVEVRDFSQVVTSCEFHLETLESPLHLPERRILLVDDDRRDGLSTTYTWREQGEDSMWTDILDGYTWDVFDTGPTFDNRVPASLVGNATTVIWAVDEDRTDNTQLLRLCTEYGNFLYSYVENGGNLIIIGRNPILAHAYWPDGSPDPDTREYFHSFDFDPKPGLGDSTYSYNFNWDVFGIREMGVPYDGVHFKTLCPCEAEWDTVTTRTIAGFDGWDGVFDNAFFITRVRGDIEAEKLYGVVPLDAGGEPGAPDCTRWLGVYVPGDGTRGHAAYIGFPPWLCDHDQTKAMLRRLLGSFGEYPAKS